MNLLLCLLQLLEVTSWPLPPFSSKQCNIFESSSFLLPSLCFWGHVNFNDCDIPAPILQRLLWLHWAHMEIPEESPHCKILNLIVSAESPLQYKVIYSQVLGFTA